MYMKIAFTGKGGSGKTTVSSLFAQLAADDGFRVLALDADINQHMASALGYKGELRSMGLEFDVIKNYLKGTSSFLVSDMHKTTPPGRNSLLLRLSSDDWFVREFATNHNGVWIAGAGDIPEGNVGVRCYHGLNGAVELVLGHMIDTQTDIIAVDMTAGADAFSSSLFTKVDALVLVVEPTMKSLSVYKQFKKYMDNYAIPIIVVGNKIQDERDRDFVLRHVDSVATWIGFSGEVRRRERGESFGSLEEEQQSQLRALRKSLLATPIDWQKRERLSHEMHRKAVKDPLIDELFSLEKIAL